MYADEKETVLRTIPQILRGVFNIDDLDAKPSLEQKTLVELVSQQTGLSEWRTQLAIDALIIEGKLFISAEKEISLTG